MSTEINVEGLAELRRRLANVKRSTMQQGDLDAVAEQIRSTILLRTRRGQYLDGSTGRGYSKGHAKKRKQLGLQTARVDLFMGQVGVLESLRARTRAGSGAGKNARITVGYIAEISEARAAEIGAYLDREGAGKNKITYRHIGLAQAEEGQILEELGRRIRAYLNDTL